MRTPAAVLALLASPLIAAALATTPTQEAPNGTRAQGAEKPRVEGTRPVVVDAAAPAVPALRHRLRYAPDELLPGNAAVGYIVFSTMVRLDHDRSQMLLDLQDVPDERLDLHKAQSVTRELDTLWDYLLLASRQADCDWQSITEPISASIFPELGPLRSLLRLIALRARVQALRGDFDGAVVTIRVGLKLATDIARGPHLIQSIAASAGVTHMLAELDRLVRQPGAPSLAWPIAELPNPLIDMSEAIRSELGIIDHASFPALREADTPGPSSRGSVVALGRLLEQIRFIEASLIEIPTTPNEPTAPFELARALITAYPRSRSALLSGGLTPQELDGMPVSVVVLRGEALRIRAARDELVTAAQLPTPQSVPAMRQAKDRIDARTHGPGIMESVVGLMTPDVVGARYSGAIIERRQAMLLTVELLRLHAGTHGRFPDTLAGTLAFEPPVDPLSGRPFLYDAAADGQSATLTAEVPAFAAPLPRQVSPGYALTLRPAR